MVSRSLKQGQNRANAHSDAQIGRLRSAVLSWFAANGRDFPWRQTSDPFHILVAEFLLRQTQAARLAGPYMEFIRRYPSARSLAKADVDELRRWFKPLGLVKRADCLIQTAQILVDNHGGKVPNDLKTLMALPGVGIYSARAVLCLAFGAPFPMIDEGSGRVLRRVLGIIPKGPAYSDSQLLQTTEAILPKTSGKEFNLSLIDIAAAYCHTRDYACVQCPLFHICIYGQNNMKMGQQPMEGQ